MKKPVIERVAGPLVIGDDCDDARIYDMVKVGDLNLTGEIIEIKGNKASIQVYEETAGIGPGEPIELSGWPLSVELGPGIIGSIYDGIQRPLDSLVKASGSFIDRGMVVDILDRKKKWKFTAKLKKGDQVIGGDILGTVPETQLVEHRIMVPTDVSGEIIEIKSGEFIVTEVVAKIKTAKGAVDVNMLTRWPVRKPRPVNRKLKPTVPLITGQRIIDTLFPMAQGGTACVPGPFGAGKTVVLHAIAKHTNADIIIYIACGERGNEVTDLLQTFPELKDPDTGRPLMERTVIIANTSNMPVAAREASVYTGMTLAEYFRDMGYSVAVMADSTSRWAEAMREISGRLEEMPGEEGYPAYLSARIASFYERSGVVECLGADNRQGSLSVIGAVSPPGGDLSDPVVQATLRVVKVFWGLDDKLANARHFPAINWLLSYSLYHDNIEEFLSREISDEYPGLKKDAMRLLEEESSLLEIARLVGVESMSDKDRLVMETAKSIREDFLHQNAFHEVDVYTDIKKQYLMIRVIMELHNVSLAKLESGLTIADVLDSEIEYQISQMRYLPTERLAELDKLYQKIKHQNGVKYHA